MERGVVSYYQSEMVNEERVNNKGNTIVVKVEKKMEKKATAAELRLTFEHEFRKLMQHQFRILHQFAEIRTLKHNLKDGDCVLQIDFSENYACKAAVEIQAMHFGGSRPQVTLHTCHATFNALTTECYCILSSDNRHCAESAWAHLEPVLDDLSTKKIKNLHIISDGPTSQYKNKEFCLPPGYTSIL